MASLPIINSKIHIPNLRFDFINRKHITQILDQSLERPASNLTLISAPAGYGKTTALLMWLKERNHNVAWLSVEEYDDTFQRFVSYLIASLQKVDSSIGLRIEQTIKRAGNNSLSIDTIISSLGNDIQNLDKPISLILDDYHFIKCPEIHKLIEAMVEYLSLRLFITTRHDLPLPLTKWRVRHQLSEIRIEDLRFDFNETKKFLNQVMKLDFSDKDVQWLEERTEGWAAALQLAGLSMRNRKDKQNTLDVIGTQRNIGDYLLKEVIDQLPVEQKDFLLQTSITDRLSASLCNAITQREDSQKLLENFETDNLFIVSLDNTREWFRYHHLFTDFLRNYLRVEYPENVVQGLHIRASHWFAENGYMQEAIDHALLAKDFEYAACILGPQSQKWMQRGETSTILKYLKQLPNDFVWKEWNLCLWYGWVYALKGDLNPAEYWTNRLEAIITPLIQYATQKEEGPIPSELQNAYVQVLAIRSVIAGHNKDFSSAVTLGEQALQLVPMENLHLKTIVSSLLSSAILESGRFDQAENLLHSTRENAYRTGNLFIAFTLLLNQSALAVMRGQLHRAYDLNTEAIQLAETKSMERLAFLPQLRLGRLHYFWNEQAQASQYINTALEQADEEKYTSATVRGYITLAWIQNAEGQYTQALQTLNRAEHIASAHHALESVEMVRGVQAQLQLWAGEKEAAVRWANASDWKLLDSSSSSLILSDESFFSYCQTLIVSHESSKWKQVKHLLEWRLMDANRQGRQSTILKIRLTQALLNHAQNQIDHVMVSVLQALEIAMPENFVRPFLDEGQPLIPYLRRVPREHIVRSFAQKILADISPSLPSPVFEQLNQQETHILQLIAQGYTNPQIAHKLLLAVSTVRWYVKQIYRKLEVHNRTQAATKARDLKLV